MTRLEIPFVRPLTALGGEEMIRNCMECSNIEIETFLSEFRGIYKKSKISSETVFGEVSETLRKIKEKGCKLSICTNKPRELAVKTLEVLNLRSFFDFEVCGGDVQKMKPAPEPLLEVTKRFNTNINKCCFIGDTVVYFKAAEQSGIDFLYYDSGCDLTLNELHHPIRITRHSQSLNYIFTDDYENGVYAKGEFDE